MNSNDFNRRQFLRTTALGVSASAGLSGAGVRPVTIVLDPGDPVAAAAASRWAAGELAGALGARGVQAHIVDRVGQAGAAICVSSRRAIARGARRPCRRPWRWGRQRLAGATCCWRAGQDARGLVYALLELADRVRNSADPAAALTLPAMVAEQPANVVRSVTRLFTSDVEDKPWFNDREMWPRYLTMLATQRFNRFNLSFGIGYDFLRKSPTPTFCSPIRSCSPCPATTCACRNCRTPSATAIWRC